MIASVEDRQGSWPGHLEGQVGSTKGPAEPVNGAFVGTCPNVTLETSLWGPKPEARVAGVDNTHSEVSWRFLGHALRPSICLLLHLHTFLTSLAAVLPTRSRLEGTRLTCETEKWKHSSELPGRSDSVLPASFNKFTQPVHSTRAVPGSVLNTGRDILALGQPPNAGSLLGPVPALQGLSHPEGWEDPAGKARV